MILKAYGKHLADPTSLQSELDDFLKVQTLHSLELFNNRSEVAPIELDLELGDVIEIEDETGFIQITTLNELHNNAAKENTRGSSADPFTLNELLEDRTAERGIIKNILKKIRIIRVDDVLADLTVAELTKRLEDKFMPNEGIFKCPSPKNLGQEVNAIPATDDPILILIHGTAVNTGSTFSGLVEEGDKTIWESIKETYKDKIYACEHKTLSKSPLENAIMLAKVLPENAKLHLITGSRGGLIGEILCQNQAEIDRETGFTEDEINVFRKIDGREEDVENLELLNQIFKEKNIRVERFVRVACPAAGTTLASERLDTYFNVILNLLRLLPFIQNGPVYKFVKSYLMAIVSKKVDTDLLPGIEAMDPKSPLIKILNNPAKSVNSELIVISGDAVPKGGILHAIKVKLIDLYYRAENDFVVNTAAMYGGIRRTSAFYFFHQHQTVNHFRYFSNPLTQQAVLKGLKGEADQGGFRQIGEEESRNVMELIRTRGFDKTKPVAYVIPGIMGSRLKAKGKKTWVNVSRLPFGAMANLKVNSPRVEAYDLMGSAYADFVEFLAASHNVECFPYDWRLSLELAASQLAESLQKKLKQTDQPIHILAHSLGGLVVQTLYTNHKEVWEEATSRNGSKVILLGSPLNGSHVIPQVMLREEHFFKLLHRMDMKHSQKELLEILLRYPGIAELLPGNLENGKAADGYDYFDNSLYESLNSADDKFFKPPAEVIANAKALRERLKKDPIQGENLYYVAGLDKRTPAKLIEDTDKDGKPSFKLMHTARGDGRVTWDSVITENFTKKIWYMDASHGSMMKEEKYFEPILELIKHGKTSGMATSPMVARGPAEEEFFEVPTTEPIALSSELDYESSLLGVTVKEATKKVVLPTVKVSITHGDLGNAKHPVAVGHHLEDGIVSAEYVMDQYLDNRLSTYHNSGIYPGDIQSSLVVLNNKGLFKGSLVVGIGKFGQLTKGDLEDTFAHGLIDLAIKEQERFENSKKASKGPLKLGVSTLLIGSSYSGLSIEDSVLSLLNGVARANEKILMLNENTLSPITEIEFIELFEDRAISLARSVCNILGNGRFLEYELGHPILKKVSGRKQKISSQVSNDWWYRLEIVEEQDAKRENTGALKFTSITDKARAEVRIVPTQRNLIDNLLKTTVSTSRFNRDVAKTLYALIVPNELKDFASDKRDIVLLLDKRSAAYPWELLHNPDETDKKPLTTQSGLIRQLSTTAFSRTVKYTLSNTALVIGNPQTPEEFSDLPGALEEAQEVASILSTKGFDVTTSFERDYEDAIVKLLSKSYKVLHIAGHGVIDKDDPAKSGVVLSNGMFITPGEIKQMYEVPEFVFVNCCYSGNMNGEAEELANRDLLADRNLLAANIGTQFIEQGVKAVVVAGWAVDDSAAKDFAKQLYKSLLNGDEFGNAVRIAREYTYSKYSHTNTWGAYQCYGSQYYQLKSGRGHRYKKASYVHPKEALIEIKNIRSSSDVRSHGEASRFINKLEVIVESLPSGWLNDTAFLESLGTAYYELGAYEKSFHYLKLLCNGDGDTYSILGVRKLSNIYMKLARKISLKGQVSVKEKKQIKEYIERSEELADWLLALGKTGFRYSLIGGNYKRKSLIVSTKPQRIAALKKSRDSYQKAYKAAESYYPLLNWLTIEEILEYNGQNKSKEIEKNAVVVDMLDKAKNYRTLKNLDSLDFWNRVSKGAFKAYELFDLAGNAAKTKKQIEQIKEIYSEAWELGGSVRKAENITEQYNFIVESLEAVSSSGLSKLKAAKLKKVTTAYRTLRTALQEILVE